MDGLAQQGPAGWSAAREHVDLAYRLVLGRPPENEDVVVSRIGQSIDQLRNAFLNSPEFRNSIDRLYPRPPLLGRHMLAAPANVQLDGPADQLAAMFDRVSATWRRLGDEEPHWSVLTQEQFLCENLAENMSAFYRSGEDGVWMLEAFLARAGLSLDASWTCVELGCGVGRITSALARRVARVHGYDVSEPHLRIARDHAAGEGLANASFTALTRIDDLSALEPFDVFFSVIVLQHNPPPVMLATLDRIFAAMKPGGVGFFQLPTYMKGYAFEWESYLAQPIGGMEMHMLPQRAIFALLERHGIRCLEVQEDSFAGDPAIFCSNSFLVQKAASDAATR